jgi:flagella basal body P-ring formation protein FlgA
MPTCRSRRQVAAAILGAALLVTPACSDGDDGGRRPEATTTTVVLSADELPVFVATAPIPAGTEAARAVDDGLLRAETVTQDQFPDDAIVTLELIEGKVAADDLAPGTIVTAGMFVDPTPAGPDTDSTDTDTTPPDN